MKKNVKQSKVAAVAKSNKEEEVVDQKLVDAAKEMNKVMGLKPEIDTDLPEAKLIEEIKINADDVRDDDVFSDETWEVLTKVAGKKKPAVKAPAVKAKADKGAKAPAAAKAPKAKGEKKVSASANKWGHRVGSQSDDIDQAIFTKKIGTFDGLVKETGLPMSRIKMHTDHLINEKGIKLNLK